MARTSYRGRECRDLLAFDEVYHRLRLGTRLNVGRREVPIAEVIGSVGRADDFDGCFRPRNARLREEIRARAESTSVIDQPISLIQVDHAYFVEDGHKRLSAAIADGRHEVDADVDRYETELHLAPGVTIGAIRATARERRFRETTGLDRAVPRQRFALSDPDGYMELEESVKAHALDLSHAEGRLLSKEEGARHWYDTVFRPVLDIIESTGACRLLGSTTDADRYLLFRKGIDVPMETGWRIPRAAIERGRANIEQRERREEGLAKRVLDLTRPARSPADLLPDEAAIQRPNGDVAPT
jgi:hypothetical protein